MEVIKEREMKLLSRKRVVLMVDHDGSTPSRLELVKEVAKKFKVKEDLVIIKHVYQQFGKNKTKLIVHIYNDKKKKNTFEHKSLLKKHEEKPVEKDEEKQAPAEKPVVEKTEKPPKEEKTEDASAAEDKKEEKTEEPKEEAPAEEEKKDD